ncbi:GmrSD restriction endonuclease domain-containing protein [Falsiruegeria mediterranea]|uniref:GmrSD restriction endonuclease domain-containing protein n=1 Tax=Falsiruegeria mediterranea TaxID=1280832 RepID=UPI0015F26FE9|nr:DUF262 domain-containing protein [Falsiruegeria mediterranea]
MSLTPKGINIQSLYNDYRSGKLIVNRRYQRKLVWSVDEKKELIHSILCDYPVPLLLFAERPGTEQIEIIDGLQRLNAIFSYIENRFQTADGYFNLETFLSAKRANADGHFEKKYSSNEECIPEESCEKILNYNLAVTTFKAPDSDVIDTVFNRINATGVKLSEQDRRQAGSTSRFSKLVNELACYVRGDVSNPVVPLHKMANISIANRQNYTGNEIIAEDVFWCANGIIHFKKLKNSGDEEVIADILSGMILESPMGVGKANLDKLYDENNQSFKDIDAKLALKGEDYYVDKFKECFADVEKLISYSDAENNKFRAHVYKGITSNEQTQIFYALFLAIFFVRNADKKIISGYDKAWLALKDVSPRIKVGQQAQNPDVRKQNIDTFKGLIGDFCIPRPKDFQSAVNTQQELKNILSASRVELEIIEYKQGFVNLHTKKWEKSFNIKIPKTLCALANSNPNNQSYLVFGVCDGVTDKNSIEAAFEIDTYEYHGWHICGVNKDIDSLQTTVDDLFGKVRKLIDSSNLSENLKEAVISGLRVFDYADRHVFIINIPPQDELSFLGDDCFVRSGNDIKQLSPKEAAGWAKKM